MTEFCSLFLCGFWLVHLGCWFFVCVVCFGGVLFCFCFLPVKMFSNTAAFFGPEFSINL